MTEVESILTYDKDYKDKATEVFESIVGFGQDSVFWLRLPPTLISAFVLLGTHLKHAIQAGRLKPWSEFDDVECSLAYDKIANEVDHFYVDLCNVFCEQDDNTAITQLVASKLFKDELTSILNSNSSLLAEHALCGGRSFVFVVVANLFMDPICDYLYDALVGDRYAFKNNLLSFVSEQHYRLFCEK